MAIVPAEVKQALAYLRSIDISLGRIAKALEDQTYEDEDEDEDDNLVWHPGHTSVKDTDDRK